MKDSTHRYISKTDMSELFQVTFKESIAAGQRPELLNWAPYDQDAKLMEAEAQMYSPYKNN